LHPAIEVIGVSKSFQPGKPVLRNVNLRIAPGEMVALIGASGSGKSTLIRAIAGLVAADPAPRGAEGHEAAGREAGVRIDGAAMQANGRIGPAAQKLRTRIGVIFQQFNLVPRLSVLMNVCLGLLGQVPGWRGTLARFTRAEKLGAMRALARVGIADQALKRGADLSGGQQQRAAIARTLVQGARIIIADEPIASLDPKAARRVMDILADLNRRDRITVLVSLHQVEYALGYCPRTVALRDGAVVFDGPSTALTPGFLGELYGAESEELFLPALGDAAAAAMPAPAPPEERHAGRPADRPADHKDALGGALSAAAVS